MRTSFIRLRANARIAVLYEDLLEVCDGNMLAAMLLSTLVYWTDTKLAQKDENLWIWKTHEGFQEDLMFDKPGMKPPHRTTISSALDLLRNKKFIEWRKNPKMPLDRTRQYLVHQEELQAAIDKLPTLESRKNDKGMSEKRLSTETATEASSEDTANVGKTTMQSRDTDNAKSKKQHSNVEKTTSNTSDYSPVITVPVITEEESTYSAGESEPAPFDANASTHAQSSSQRKPLFYSLDQGLKQPWEEQGEPYHPTFPTPLENDYHSRIASDTPQPNKENTYEPETSTFDHWSVTRLYSGMDEHPRHATGEVKANHTPQGDTNGRQHHSNRCADTGTSGHDMQHDHARTGIQALTVTKPNQRSVAQADGTDREQTAPGVASQSVPGDVGYMNPHQGNAQAQLSTLSAGSPQASAKVAPVDVTTLTIASHVNLTFKWLDAVRKKAEKNPMASYVQNKTAEGLVRNLIQSTMNTPNELTEQNIYIAWMAMWKSPAGRDGFTWGEPGKISIAAFCRNYGDYLARGKDSLAKAQRQSQPSTNTLPVLVGVSGRRKMDIQPPVRG